jgi:hypothetical protein
MSLFALSCLRRSLLHPILVMMFILILNASVQKAICGQMIDTAHTLSFSGEVDTYFLYDFNKQPNNELPGYFYNYRRTNEFSVNIAMIRAQYSAPRYRCNFALMAGLYPQYNLSGEQELMRSIYEASVGFALDEEKTLWIDGGIMPSYIGFESALVQDNWTLTRDLPSEATPFYFSGIRLTYQPDEHFSMLAMLNNGWQRIRRVGGSSHLSFGTEIMYKPSTSLLFNWSTFIGSDDPDSIGRTRIFNDFYATWSVSKKVQMTIGFDIGYQSPRAESNRSSDDIWYSPVLLLRFKPTEQWAMVFRTEYFYDPYSVIVATETPNGFQVGGSSVTLEFIPIPNTSLRLESRWFESVDKIFTNKGLPSTVMSFLAFGMSVKFP